jgi:cytochrome d ubiquinol oxidase subunit I
MDTLLLSRIQFALNISFHILFPVITIGLAWILFYFRLQFVRTKDSAWEVAYYRTVKIFAITFALGVVSGVTMSFQFGTNWPGFMEKVGDIAGPLLGYEVLTAFFLEASFLGIMLYGKDRVSNRVHLFSALMVAMGTSLSAFWILSLNSWMQTPAGYVIENGRILASDWWQIVFNPSFPYRLTHKMLASFATVAFLLAGLAAWRMLAHKGDRASVLMLRTGVILGAVILPLQIWVGDLHGLNTLEHQPAKIAAMEGVWHTERGAPLVLFAWPDKTTQSNHFAVEIPKLASLILTHDPEGEIKGLNEFQEFGIPNVPWVFWSFRIMVGMGILMLIVAFYSAWRLWRQRKKNTDAPFATWHLRVLQLMTFSGWVATLAGWYVTEIGRQPWIVYGLLKTSDVVAPHPPQTMGLTLGLYIAVYVGLMIAYIGAVRYLALKTENPTQTQAHI